MRTFDGQERMLAAKNLKSPHKLGKYGVDLNALENVGVPALTARYWSVNVFEPAVSPVTKYVALPCASMVGLPLPAVGTIKYEVTSEAARVVAPDTAKLIAPPSNGPP